MIGQLLGPAVEVEHYAGLYECQETRKFDLNTAEDVEICSVSSISACNDVSLSDNLLTLMSALPHAAHIECGVCSLRAWDRHSIPEQSA